MDAFFHSLGGKSVGGSFHLPAGVPGVRACLLVSPPLRSHFFTIVLLRVGHELVPRYGFYFNRVYVGGGFLGLKSISLSVLG